MVVHLDCTWIRFFEQDCSSRFMVTASQQENVTFFQLKVKVKLGDNIYHSVGWPASEAEKQTGSRTAN